MMMKMTKMKNSQLTSSRLFSNHHVALKWCQASPPALQSSAPFPTARFPSG